MKEREKAQVFGKYEFKDFELKAIAKNMANAVSDIETLTDRLKSVKSQIKAEIDEATAVMNSCAKKLQTGYEMRDLDCEVVYDFKGGQVLYISEETGETVKSRKMTDEDRQQELME